MRDGEREARIRNEGTFLGSLFSVLGCPVPTSWPRPSPGPETCLASRDSVIITTKLAIQMVRRLTPGAFMSMTQKDLFRELGAPLANARWSWGSVRRDGVVFLRVWQDETEKRDGTLYVRVACELEDEGGSLGYQERLRHIELVRQGAVCYLIICQADDIAAIPRKVKDFDCENVFRGGRIVRIDSDWWIELVRRVPIREVALSPK